MDPERARKSIPILTRIKSRGTWLSGVHQIRAQQRACWLLRSRPGRLQASLDRFLPLRRRLVRRLRDSQDGTEHEDDRTFEHDVVSEIADTDV